MTTTVVTNAAGPVLGIAFDKYKCVACTDRVATEPTFQTHVLDAAGRTILDRDLPPSPAAFDAVKSFRDGLVVGGRVHVRLVLARRFVRVRTHSLRPRARGT